MSDGPVWAILYDDVDLCPAIFVGHGSENAARKRFEIDKDSWSCTLMARAPSPELMERLHQEFEWVGRAGSG